MIRWQGLGGVLAYSACHTSREPGFRSLSLIGMARSRYLAVCCPSSRGMGTGESLRSVRGSVSKNKLESSRRKYSISTSSLHVHLYTHIHTRTHTVHTCTPQIKTKQNKTLPQHFFSPSLCTKREWGISKAASQRSSRVQLLSLKD